MPTAVWNSVLLSASFRERVGLNTSLALPHKAQGEPYRQEGSALKGMV